jgi:hypothetical protein
LDTQPPLPGVSELDSSKLADAASNMAIIGTQQECRPKLVHHNAANAATKYMTQDAQLKILHKTGSSNKKKLHAVG